MARASSLQIREAIADALRDHYTSQVTDLDVQVEPRMVFNVTPPTFDIWPNTPATDPNTEAFGEAHGAFRFFIRVVVSGDEEAQQELLYAAMDETDELCVAAALYEDQFDGYIASISVDAPTGFEYPADIIGSNLLSVRFPVTVIAGES